MGTAKILLFYHIMQEKTIYERRMTADMNLPACIFLI